MLLKDGDMSLQTALESRAICAYQSFSIRMPGRDKPVILRASPKFRDTEWYDFIRVQQQDGSSCVAKVLTLVSIAQSGSKKSRQDVEGNAGGASLKLRAFVEYYASALQLPQRSSQRRVHKTGSSGSVVGTKRVATAVSFYGQPVFDEWSRDMEHLHTEAGIPLVTLEPHAAHRYGLIPTESILGGLWVQPSFQDPRSFWVIYNGIFR